MKKLNGSFDINALQVVLQRAVGKYADEKWGYQTSGDLEVILAELRGLR